MSGRGPLVAPVHLTSTFVLEDAEDVDAVYEGRREGDTYSRLSNPTLTRVANHVAQLEGAEAGSLMASGMAAIACTVMALVPSGGRLVATEDLYGGTTKLFETLAQRFGVQVHYVPTREPDVLRAALDGQRADLVYLETPTNPTHRVVDLEASARIARAHGVPSVVDSTFASPYNTKPLSLGIDLVLHSATKYLSGHSDLTAGVVCGPRALVDRVEDVKRTFGPVLDPHAAFLLERGLRTMALRVAAANANALAVAQFLEQHPRVERVHYAGLPSHPQHALARRQMRGFGGVLSFDLASFAEAKRFMDALRLIRNAASLGGVESLCSLPVQQSHRNQPPDVLERSGITPGTVRLAIGVEDEADLVADLRQALERSAA